MVRKIVLLISALLFSFAASALAADPKPAGAATQGDLARKIVDRFGWGEGLPEKAADKDYLAILGGKRSYRFEAEDVYDKGFDKVTVRNHDMFGPFTGKGWLHGITVPTAVHFKAFIPIAGNYTLRAATKGDGQLWSVAGKAFRVNAGATMKEMVIGQMFVPAGTMEFNAVIPADGGVDYISFNAPGLAPVEPLAGWNMGGKLTAGNFAEVAAVLLGNEELLPADPAAARKSFPAAALSPLPDAVYLTDSQILGKPLSVNWVRSGTAGGEMPFPVEVDEAGVYQLRVRYVGGSVKLTTPERSVTAPAKPYLEWVDCGAFRLPKGKSSIIFSLGSADGVDAVELVRKKTSPAEYVELVKTGKGSEEQLSQGDLDQLLRPVVEKFRERR